MHSNGAMADTVQSKPNNWQTFALKKRKKKEKSEFRQILKTLNVKYRKVHFFKSIQLDAAEGKKGFPCHFSIFYISLPICFMAEEEIEPEFSGPCWVAAQRRASQPHLL